MSRLPRPTSKFVFITGGGFPGKGVTIVRWASARCAGSRSTSSLTPPTSTPAP